MGTEIQARQGQIPSRQVTTKAKIPFTTKTETVNKVCASGMRAITLADQLIRLGEERIIVAGGMESMSNAPYLLPNARFKSRLGHQKIVDSMLKDGLICSFHKDQVHMGIYGEEKASEFDVSRQLQDEWAVRSHQRAANAKEQWKEELVFVKKIGKDGETIILCEDECVRPNTSLEQLAKLPPVFLETGTITAGNAPTVNDGACAVVLMEETLAREAQKDVLATILGHVEIAVDPSRFLETPGLVIRQLLKKTNKSLADIDLFEVNEAFAAVAIISKRIAHLDVGKVNVNGGAVALGHPIGASRARIVHSLAYELKRQGGGIGIAAICSGGGQGDAVMIEVN